MSCAGGRRTIRSYTWDSVPYGRSALSKWQIYCIQDNDIRDISGKFTLRNGGTIPYYVNDGSTNGDVYCTAIGNDANDGLTPATPVASLSLILSTNDLDPSDVVYVDSGSYPAGSPAIKIDQTDSGWSNLYVTIQGSTNPLAATVFQATFNDPEAFAMEYAVNVRLKNLTIKNAKVGLRASLTIGCELDNVRIEGNQEVGLSLDRSESFRAVRSVFWKNKNNSDSTVGKAINLVQSPVTIENCVLWGSPSAISAGSASLVTASNSVLSAYGSSGRIYMFPTGGGASNSFRGDYNCYYRRDSALIAEQPRVTGGSDKYSDQPNWVADTSGDKHSISTVDLPFSASLFADEVNGDFHAKSTKGRYFNGIWTNDAALSPLVDAGGLSWPATNEPAPNGGIINLGAYGNTAEASMSQTNPPWLRCITYNCEGRYSGNAMLYWTHGGMPSNTPVRLEYSTDYEISWQPITTNVVAGKREYLWDVSLMPLSLAVNWRVTSLANTNISDVSDCPLSIKVGTYDYYINDASTIGDIWCSGPGVPWDPYNPPGTNPAMPIDSLNSLLARYPVGAGDRIFIDTGVYPATDAGPIVFSGNNTGTADEPLKVYGSTNVAFGGALFLGNGSVDGITVQNSGFIEIYDLRVSKAKNGLSLVNVDTVTLKGLEMWSNTIHGIFSSACSGVDLKNSRLWKNGGYGFYSYGSKGGQSLVNATLWGNPLGAAWNDSGQLNITNSILVVTNSAPIYTESGIGLIGGDYNLFGLVSNRATIAYNDRLKVYYSNLRQWQTAGRDVRSFVGTPFFVSPSSGNFHLQSRAGYWSNGAWFTNATTNTSWAIDAGNPASLAYTNEPSTNGGRINLGAYGGTREASKSDSSVAEMLPTTLWDGGVAPAGQSLYWLYRGINPTNTVRIEYSPYRGDVWVLVQDAIPINSAPYDWFSSVDATPEALWRIMLTADTNNPASTLIPFTLRTSALTYYVNDGSTNGDVYCTAIGSPTNWGFLPSSPMDSIVNVLTNRQLIGGDEIKVDTGVYVMTSNVFWSSLNVGSESNRIQVTGSTNLLAGGSWLQSTNGSNVAFEFLDAYNVNFSNFRLTGFSNGVIFSRSSDCKLSKLDIESSVGPGVWVQQSPRIELERVVVRGGATNAIKADASIVSLNSCVLWSNGWSTVNLVGGSTMKVTNSVLQVAGAGNYCYRSETSAVIQANYNNLVLQDGAQVASIEDSKYETLPPWVLGTSQDRNSLSTNPRFHDPANGDFHLRSVAGRYHLTNGWVQDIPDVDLTDPLPFPLTNLPDFSPMIDMGSPKTGSSNEPPPHGGRRNIGLYGNTLEASKSNTNRWLQCITAMSGGVMFGGINLTWGYGGDTMASNLAVQLEYSYDDRQTWIRMGETVVGAGQYFWQSDQTQASVEIYPSNPDGLWRIYVKVDTNTTDMVDDYFGLRNSPFKYYINDTSTVADVYATVPGDDSNRGTYPGSPLLNLRTLLQNRQIGAGDYVYVDTGIYRMSDTNAPWLNSTNSPIRWETSDGGESGLPVLLRGSTNVAGSRYLATNRYVAGAFFFMEASYVDMQDLMFEGESLVFTGHGLAGRNLSLTNGSLLQWGDDSVFEDFKVDRGSVSLYGSGTRVTRMTQLRGETLIVGTNVSMVNSVVYTTNNNTTGVVVNAVNAAISNSTIVATRGTAVGKRGPGTVRLGHNILAAGGTDASSVIKWEEGVLISDWNNLQARDSAWTGIRNGKWEKLAYWRTASGQDANSVSFDPLFQNETAGDFHLKSIVGRWSPVLQLWDTNGTHSPLIDLGNPAIGTTGPGGTEPPPNGYRPNLGAYGRSGQASKSLGHPLVDRLDPERWRGDQGHGGAIVLGGGQCGWQDREVGVP